MSAVMMKRRRKQKKLMAKRLPSPGDPVFGRCVIDAAEMKAVEDAAHLCRLSVASFIRVALIESAEAGAGRVAAWQKIAERLMSPDEASPIKRPGRPKKKPSSGA